MNRNFTIPQKTEKGIPYMLLKLIFIFTISLIINFNVSKPLEARSRAPKKWTNRVIPLPKQVEITGSITKSSKLVELILPKSNHVVMETIEKLLRPIANGRGDFKIRLVMTTGKTAKACPPKVIESLHGLPNSDEAYAIEPIIINGGFSGLLLVGNTPLGLHYAARTLKQLVTVPTGNFDEIEFPIVSILDWPDLLERGMWVYPANSFRWFAEHKLNLLEGGGEKELEEGAKLGIKIVPIYYHMDGLGADPLFKTNTELKATLDPEKQIPIGLRNPVCFSNPKTTELLTEIIKNIISVPGVTDFIIWLSECEFYCHCPKCKGRNTFELEVKSLVKAFNKAKKVNSKASMRILTSQSSYKVNESVIASLDTDTKLTFYDGFRTYDSSHRTLIYPLLEKFARSGHWLGVYPQFDNSWRTTFPFTGPQFIQARMNEFVSKKLSNCSGFVYPLHYGDFNIAASSEWGWNSTGRTPREFAEAYAVRTGKANPLAFSIWAEIIGDVGWDVAGSRIVEGLIYNQGLNHSIHNVAPGENFLNLLPNLKFGEGIYSEFSNREIFDESLSKAEKKLQFVIDEGDPLKINCYRCFVGTLRLLDGLKNLSESLKLSNGQDSPDVESAVSKIHEAGKILNAAMWNPERFHKWQELKYTVVNLNGIRIVEALAFNPLRTFSVRGTVAGKYQIDALSHMEFGQGLFYEIPSREKFEENVNQTLEALEIAKINGDQLMILESKCVLGVLRLLDGLKHLSDSMKQPDNQRIESVKSSLTMIDIEGKKLTESLCKWCRIANPVQRENLGQTARESIDGALAAASDAWEIGKELGIKDLTPEYRMHTIREWSKDDFVSGEEVTFWNDITDLIKGSGEYDVTLKYLQSDAGIVPRSVAVYRGTTKDNATLVDKNGWRFGIGSSTLGGFGCHIDYWLSIPENSNINDRYFLKVVVTGPSPEVRPDRPSCRGKIMLRKSWRDGIY